MGSLTNLPDQRASICPVLETAPKRKGNNEHAAGQRIRMGAAIDGLVVTPPNLNVVQREVMELSGEPKSILPWPGGHVNLRILVGAVAGVATI